MMIKICCKRDYLVGWDKAKYANAVGIVIRQLKEFHAKIKEEKDLTQKELAEKLMTTTTTVARWDLGMSVPKQDRMIREIKALGISW